MKDHKSQQVFTMKISIKYLEYVKSQILTLNNIN